MAHNTFVLLQLLEYDRQESGMNIYNALKIKAQSVPVRGEKRCVSKFGRSENI